MMMIPEIIAKLVENVLRSYWYEINTSMNFEFNSIMK